MDSTSFPLFDDSAWAAIQDLLSMQNPGVPRTSHAAPTPPTRSVPPPHNALHPGMLSSAHHASNTSNLELLAALAQSPAFSMPGQTGREADFDHALAGALRLLLSTTNGATAPFATPPTLPHPHAPSSNRSNYDAFPTWAGSTSMASPSRGPPPQSHGHGEAHAMPPPPPPSNTRARSRSTTSRSNSTASTSGPPAAIAEEDAEQEEYPADPEEVEAIEEDKRRRNTAASARFRAKKKQQVINMERSISELTGRADELEKEAADLRRENGWLKEIVMLKGRALAGSPLPELTGHRGSAT